MNKGIAMLKRYAAGLATLAAIGLVAPEPTRAQVGETVAQFYQSCRAERGRVNGRCDSYIEGAADTLAAFGKGGDANGICGGGYNKGELSRIFMAWVPRNRNTWGFPRLAGVTIALREAYPCRRGS
jgi:hypothetical protein